MRSLHSFLLIFLSFVTFSQEISGTWYGKLYVMGSEQQIGIVIDKKSNSYEVGFINPTTPSRKLLIDSVNIQSDNFYFNSIKLGIVYEGKIYKDSLSGNFQQNGYEIPLVLTRNLPTIKEVKRPQTPVPPFDYSTEEIKVENKKGGLILSGTLTLPTTNKGKYPVVVLISGSGPQNRDSEILGHKSFAVIADHLAKQGIGSFRYDERGVGKSTGVYEGSDLFDFYEDVDAIVSHLLQREEISRLGLAGHSEGGIIAPWYASEHKKSIDFVMMLAGPGMAVKDMMHLQRKLQYESMGMSEQEIASQKQLFVEIDKVVIEQEGEIKTKSLTEIFINYSKENKYTKEETEQYTRSQLKVMDGAWYKSFVTIVPADYLRKVRCPILVIQGGKDKQVPMEENIAEIKTNLKKKGLCKKKIVIKTYPDLNHLFQPCKTGNVEEYGEIETTIDRRVLFAMSDFIKEI